MKSELFFVKSGRKREWNMDEFRIIVCMKKEVIFQFPVSTTPWKRDKRQAVISGAEEGIKYSTALLGWGCGILSFTASFLLRPPLPSPCHCLLLLPIGTMALVKVGKCPPKVPSLRLLPSIPAKPLRSVNRASLFAGHSG